MMSTSSRSCAISTLNANLRATLVVGGLIFAASLVSILTRLWTGFAYVWLPNALLLGLFIRFPTLSNPGAWVGAALGYLLADLMADASWKWALQINTGNFLGVVAGYALLSRLSPAVRKLEQPASLLWVALVAVLASTTTAVYSGFFPTSVAMPGFWRTAWTWFSFELANYLILLPLVLAWPAWPRAWVLRRPRSFTFKHLMPLLPGVALLLSFFMMSKVGGPVAIAYPFTALLWCAIAYPKFVTVLLTTLCSFLTLYLTWRGVLPGVVLENESQRIAVSVRLGVALIALGPVMVASVMAARGRLLHRLKYLAEHDQLTGLYNRHAFTEQAQQVLARKNRPGHYHTVLMMDLDHFKRINDNYGHQAGDLLLSGFAQILLRRLRSQDVLGRVGGEEFAVLLPDCDQEAGRDIAERIRRQVEQEPWTFNPEDAPRVTVSIGVTTVRAAAGLTLNTLLEQADAALYEAKAQGRNRVVSRSF